MQSDSSKPSFTLGLALAALALFVLRHDLWLRDSGAIVAGLPVSLLYHLIFCFVASGVFAVLMFPRRRT